MFTNKTYRKYGRFVFSGDKEVVILLHDYFLSKNNPIFQYYFARKIIRFLFIHYTTYLAFGLKITKPLSNSFLIQRTGAGRNPNIITLYKIDNKYSILKSFTDESQFQNEVEFLNKYQNRNLKIPRFSIKENTINYAFTIGTRLGDEISYGRYTSDQLITLTDRFKLELEKFYCNSSTDVLIHGDMGLANIFYDSQNGFTIVDFSDSEIYKPRYDLFTFVTQIIQFSRIKNGDTFLKRYFSDNEINEYTNHRLEKELKKHSHE